LIGKSNIFRKQDLEKIGGLSYFSKYLGEDGMISQKLHDIGKYKVVGSDFVFQHIGSPPVMDFVNRRIRWCRVRKQVSLSSTILEPLSESIVNCYLMAMYFEYYFGLEFRLGFLGMLLFWFCSDLLLTSLIYSTINLKLDLGSYLAYCLAWIVREVFALPLYLWGMSGSEIQWRDKRYTLYMNGEVKTSLVKKGKEQVKENMVQIMDKEANGIEFGKDLLPKGA
jgi:ceramide glucosyltransferase